MIGVKKMGRGALMAAGAVAAMAGSAAYAQEGPTFSYNIGATTDYVFRGISQSDGDYAIQGGVDMTYGQFYGGVWASTIDFGLDEEAEVDFYGGFKPVVGPVTLDFGFVYYFYPGLDDSTNGNYLELKAGASTTVMEGVNLGAALYWSPEFTFTSGENALYGEINGSVALGDKVTLSGAVGRQDVDVAGYYFDAGDGDSAKAYTTWNVGLSYSENGFTLDGRYYDTSLDEVDIYGPSGNVVSDKRLVGSIKLAF